MATTTPKGEAFSIIKKSPKDYELYQSNKCIAKADVDYQGNLFYLAGRPETLFNFDASLLPPKFEYQLVHEQPGFFDWYGLVAVSTVQKKILMEYCFSIDSDLLVNHDVNPLNVLKSAMALAKKAGYKVYIDKDDYLVENRYASIKVHIPAKGNLYQHYQKHLQKFKGHFQASVASVTKRIIKSHTKKNKG